MASQITVDVRLYASYREQAGRGRVDVSIAVGGTVADLIAQLMLDVPSLPQNFRPHLIAVNDEFANVLYPVAHGDEVALYPPVSGGVDVAVGLEASDAREVADAVRRSSNGAVVTFEGTTRDETNGKGVLFLEYESDEHMAVKIIGHILEETSARFGVPALAARHRIGRLEIGEVSLVVAAAAPHRLEAFLATQYAVDRIKHIVPVWKKEHFTNGSVWIGVACEPEHHARELAEAPYARFLAERESAQAGTHQHTHA